MKPITEAQQLLPNEDAQHISHLSLKAQHGNFTIEDMNDLMSLVKKHTKLPKDVQNKMSHHQLLAELGGLLTPDQSYTYYELPKRVIQGMPTQEMSPQEQFMGQQNQSQLPQTL